MIGFCEGGDEVIDDMGLDQDPSTVLSFGASTSMAAVLLLTRVQRFDSCLTIFLLHSHANVLNVLDTKQHADFLQTCTAHA